MSVGSRMFELGFGRPTGPLGRMGGQLMARMNDAVERQLVELAELDHDDVVLVLGPGPGVGLAEAGARAGRVIGVDPSETMLRSARRRCGELIRQGRVRLVCGVAERTGEPDASVTVVFAVNTVQLWPDWDAAFRELHRVLRPGGRLMLATHENGLPGGPAALAVAVEGAGFVQVRTWTWEPAGRGASTTLQLNALRP